MRRQVRHESLMPGIQLCLPSCSGQHVADRGVYACQPARGSTGCCLQLLTCPVWLQASGQRRAGSGHLSTIHDTQSGAEME